MGGLALPEGRVRGSRNLILERLGVLDSGEKGSQGLRLRVWGVECWGSLRV